MTKKRTIAALAVIVILLNASSALAQAPETGPPSFFDELVVGRLWGQLFIGGSEADDKDTLNDIEIQFAKQLHYAMEAQGSRTTFGSAAASSASRAKYSLMMVGAVDLAHYGFGNGDGFSVISVLGGLRLLPKPGKKIWPYGELLAGVQHSFGENALAISPRGGVIIPIGKLFLSAQGGFETALYSDASDTGLRARVGLTFPLGSR